MATTTSWPVEPVVLAPAPTTEVGVILLATDRASSVDVPAFVPDDVVVHATRIPMDVVATPETLAAMEAHLEDGARVLVPGGPLAAISFSCTSGSVAIGPETVRRRIGGVRPGVPVVNPVDAAVAGLVALGARRVALLVPYLEGPAELIRGYAAQAGIETVARATFDLPGDPEMNRVPAEAIIDVAARLGAHPEAEAVFISCTGLSTRDVVVPLEERLGKPVVTSNQAQAWALLRAAGRADRVARGGRLFTV